jgi:hypothetical protein
MRAMNMLVINRLWLLSVRSFAGVALLLVLGAALLLQLGLFNPVPGADEGLPARLFQLDILLLLLAGLLYLATADWQAPWRVLRGLMWPLASVVLAFAILLIFEARP